MHVGDPTAANLNTPDVSGPFGVFGMHEGFGATRRSPIFQLDISRGVSKGIGKKPVIANVACYFVGWLKVVGGSTSWPVARSCSTLRARSSAAAGICDSSLGLYTRLSIPSCIPNTSIPA